MIMEVESIFKGHGRIKVTLVTNTHSKVDSSALQLIKQFIILEAFS